MTDTIQMKDTIKLFDSAPYEREFAAKVLAARPSENPGDDPSRRICEVILDRTLFFPEEGGQTPDRGELGGFPVIDVQLQGGVIRHFIQLPENGEKTCSDFAGEKPESVSSASGASAAGAACSDSAGEKPESVSSASGASAAGAAGSDSADQRQESGIPFFPGQEVRGRIDFDRRFSNMQNHTGEHILSGLVHKKYGYDNVGFHLSDNTVTLDFNGVLSDSDIAWLEAEANRVVWDNIETHAFYPSEEELAGMTYRSKKEIDGPLRIVEIPGVDVCACCAPHVRRTGEVGVIKILRTLREKGGIRLTILCGRRALEYLQALQRAAEEVSHLTNMPREEIAAGAARLLEEIEQLRRREAFLESAVTDALAAGVPAEQEDVFLFLDGGTVGSLAQRRLVNTLCAAHPGFCGVFSGSDEGGYRYIIGAGRTEGSSHSDARVLNACLHKYCGARGGGKPEMVQGSAGVSKDRILSSIERALHSAPQA